ncbi:hypothetical protein [Streptomonospora litoralis]|uniref:Uncharacterized protein n=1 Tax=Streptomonospora litoralis TaxID=2498135 RepID=A0A4P6PZB4_9ACTN|nr:hypothetical protein [Streptomonospora litoralis]QBI53535.1 hypothetical protein EKD16_08705 [Streptomonospora litoralis]
MEQEQEARAALEDVRRRQESVSRELGRYRPTGWMTAMYVLGMYTVLATTELGPAIALPAAACGFGVMVAGVALAVRRAAHSGVQPRRVWTPWRLVAAVSWLAGIYGVFWLAEAAVRVHLPEWQAPFVAAAPAALATWLFAEWLWWLGFGPRRFAAEGSE